MLRTYIQNSHIAIRRYGVISKVLGGELPPTDIQKKVTEEAKKRHTVIKAPVSSGKTISYLLPSLKIVRDAMIKQSETERPGFRGLILTPKHERATLIAEMINEYAQHQNLNNLTARTIMGGRSLQREIDIIDLIEPEIVVATIGRLSSHLNNSDYFRNLQFLVIDDAHSFDPSDAKLNSIFPHLNSKRRTFVVGDESLNNDVPKEWLGDNAESVSVVESNVVKQTDNVKTEVVQADGHKDVFEKVAALTQKYHDKRTVVFSPSSEDATFMHYVLAENNILSTLLTVSQAGTVRHAAYQSFLEARKGLLLTSRYLQDVVPEDVEVVISVGHVSDSDKQVQMSRLKNEEGSSHITVQFQPYDKQPSQQVTLNDLQPLQLKVGPISQKVFGPYYNHTLRTLRHNKEADEDQANRVTDLAKEFELTPPKIKVRLAEDLGLVDALSKRNLLKDSNDKRSNQLSKEEVKQRVDERAKNIRDSRIKKRGNKDFKNAADQRKKLKEIQEETEKLSKITFN
ncbi:DEAD-box ATP-dependent RNA helicase [Acrasis kona]|uniref:ATP-dependent RNA helicase n=1 Tax=Acrasis kona TaxID=1008807 RepID=A0AAW2YYF1_9EUKA